MIVNEFWSGSRSPGGFSLCKIYGAVRCERPACLAGRVFERTFVQVGEIDESTEILISFKNKLGWEIDVFIPMEELVRIHRVDHLWSLCSKLLGHHSDVNSFLQAQLLNQHAHGDEYWASVSSLAKNRGKLQVIKTLFDFFSKNLTSNEPTSVLACCLPRFSTGGASAIGARSPRSHE